MRLLFLKLIKNKAKGQKMQKTDSNNQNLQENFGLLVKGNGGITTPVTKFFGTFEEFSQSVDEIFEGSFPRNILEKKAKKVTVPNDETNWYCLEVTNEQFGKVLVFFYSKSLSLADAEKSLADALRENDELKKQIKENKKNKSVKSLFQNVNNPIIFAEDRNAQENDKADQKIRTKVKIKN